jgi:UDP-2,4-diacetamido-2,4,6-trideoxy-beta-L-altropyranose hydrolase
MLKNKIYFRVDASHEIGLGHFYRCLALANMLKKNFNIFFYCFKIPDKLSNLIVDNNYFINNIINEKDFFNDILENIIVVIDGYHFNSEYQKKIKKTGASLVCIDDLASGHYYADLIINQNINISKNTYSIEYYTKFAFGPDYILLRQSFLNFKKQEKQIKNIKSILICFGGSDNLNLTYKVLQTVLKNHNETKVVVITGLEYKRTKLFNELIINNSQVEHYIDINESKMANLLANVDLAIVPASGILMEAISIGNIIISGYYAENQKFVYNNYKKMGVFIDAFDFSTEKIQNALKLAFYTKFKKINLIDRDSEKRLLKLFTSLSLRNKIKVRNANKNDLEITYKWATNKLIRKYSFNKKEISKSEHFIWFNNKIKNNNTLFLIFFLSNKKVGLVRFDKDNENAHTVSYLLDEKYHGLGLGREMLIKGIEYFKNIYSKTNIYAFVQNNNIASIKIFKSLNFTEKKLLDRIEFKLC